MFVIKVFYAMKMLGVMLPKKNRLIFTNSDIDKGSEFEYPPYKIPKWLVPEYTYGGRVPISYNYRDDSRKDDDSKSKNIKLLEDSFGNIYWGPNLIKWIETQVRSNTFEGI